MPLRVGTAVEPHGPGVDGGEAASSLTQRHVRELVLGRHARRAQTRVYSRTAVTLLDVSLKMRMRRTVEAAHRAAIHARLDRVLVEHVLGARLRGSQHREAVRALVGVLLEHDVGRLGRRR